MMPLLRRFLALRRPCVPWVLALTLAPWGAAAEAQRAPAAAPPKAASAPAPGSADEARALIGWEYQTVPEDQIIQPGLSCRAAGSGPITIDGDTEIPGWRALTYDCDDHVTLALARSWHDPVAGKFRYRLVDAVALPGATMGATLYHRKGLAITGTDNNCKLDGRYNPNLVVTMRRVKREWLTWRNGLVAAWTYDLKRGRIVQVPIKRVVCYQELDP